MKRRINISFEVDVPDESTLDQFNGLVDEDYYIVPEGIIDALNETMYDVRVVPDSFKCTIDD